MARAVFWLPSFHFWPQWLHILEPTKRAVSIPYLKVRMFGDFKSRFISRRIWAFYKVKKFIHDFRPFFNEKWNLKTLFWFLITFCLFSFLKYTCIRKSFENRNRPYPNCCLMNSLLSFLTVFWYVFHLFRTSPPSSTIRCSFIA